MISNFDDVGAFHHKFDLPFVLLGKYVSAGVGPQEMEDDLLLFRANFLLEELEEFLEATGLELDSVNGRSRIVKSGRGAGINHAQAFDALLDLVYVAMGTAHLSGYPWQKGWDEVQRANMSKQRAVRPEESKRGTAWDVVKPDGWTAPDIDGVLAYYGFDA